MGGRDGRNVVGGERWLNIPPAMCYGDENYLSGMPEGTNWQYNSMIISSNIPQTAAANSFAKFCK